MEIKGIIAIFCIAACIFTCAAAANEQEPSSPEQGILIGMPDPSASWAEQMGYNYVIRTNPTAASTVTASSRTGPNMTHGCYSGSPPAGRMTTHSSGCPILLLPGQNGWDTIT